MPGFYIILVETRANMYVLVDTHVCMCTHRQQETDLVSILLHNTSQWVAALCPALCQGKLRVDKKPIKRGPCKGKHRSVPGLFAKASEGLQIDTGRGICNYSCERK